jgi:hypothetical protein
VDYPVQDYEIIDFKAGDFKDNYNNYYCTMALRGISEAVTIATPDPTKFHTGMLLYGTIEHKISRAQKPYLKFKRMQKEDAPTAPRPQAEFMAPAAAPKKEWQPESPERQHSINRSVALNNAAAVNVGKTAEVVLATADAFYEWLDGSPVKTVSPEEERAQKQASADEARLRNTFQEDEVYPVEDEPIDLNQIPF